LAACLAVVAAALAACGSSSATPSSNGGNQTVTFAGDGFTLGAEAYVGQSQGYFAQQHLSAQVTTFATGVDGINAMIANQVQFAFGLDFAAVSTATKYVAVLGTVGSPSGQGGYNQMYFAPGVTKPSQLAGKKIGVLAGTAQEYVTDKWIDKYGLTGKVQTVNLPGLFELVGALKARQISAAFVYGDGTTQAQHDRSLYHFGDDSGLIKVQGIYLLTLRKTAEENPQLVLRTLRALKQATTFMAANPTTAGEIVAKAEPGSDAKALTDQLELDNEGLGMTSVQTQAILEVQSFLRSRQKITNGVDIRTSLDLGPLHQVLGESK
jgi:NitT/TauT family transport system substrate-binding protein